MALQVLAKPFSVTMILTIACSNKILGHVSVQEHNAQRISGQFSRGADYAEFAAYFETMTYWSEQFDLSRKDNYAGEIDPYWAWDKWSEAGAQLTELGLTIPELDTAIREFSFQYGGRAVIFVEMPR